MAEIAFAFSGFDRPIALFGGLASDPLDEAGELVGALVVTQTQTRISSEKTSPSGEAWKANLMGTSILFRSGALNSSIRYTAAGGRIEVGSDLIYARIHNAGGEIKAKNKKALRYPGQAGQDIRVTASVMMPKREYLGLSPANAAEITTELQAWLSGKMQ